MLVNMHKSKSALAPQRVSQPVHSLARLAICSWLSGVSFNVSWNWCCRLAEKENENAISCTVDIMFLTIQWFFNARRFNLAASLLLTDSKVLRKKFKSVLQNLQVMTTVKSQAGGKKSVGPGLQPGYAPVTWLYIRKHVSWELPELISHTC